MNTKWEHISVMKQESIDFLNIDPEKNYVDATLGLGGHSKKIVDKLSTGKLICIDTDEEALTLAQKNLKEFDEKIIFCNDNLANIKNIIKEFNFESISGGILADLGVSSMELDNSERGFSFLKNADLDMRMNRNQSLTAKYIVNNYSITDLINIFKIYGDEKFPGRIARAICDRRRKKSIKETLDLASIIKNSVPIKFQNTKIHPATKVFQALRIEVNDELNVLKKFLLDSIDLLESKARLVIISFHSGEDRIVKNVFRDKYLEGSVKLLTRKPLTPSEYEINENIRSRSAKMRILEKI